MHRDGPEHVFSHVQSVKSWIFKHYRPGKVNYSHKKHKTTLLYSYAVTKDQLTVCVKTLLNFIPYFLKVFDQTGLLHCLFTLVFHFTDFERGQFPFSYPRQVEGSENVCTIVTGHIAYRKLSAGVMRSPTTQIVYSTIDDNPVIALTVMFFHLF